MMRTGEAHFTFPVPYEQAAVLEKDEHLKLVAAPSIVTRYLNMNMLQKPFDDLRVRQAINYAINKEALAKVAFSGYAFPSEARCRRRRLCRQAWSLAVQPQEG